MNLTKSERYAELVTKFKKHIFTDPALTNPHKIFKELGFNYDVINPWELWHNNLDAEILFIGQDFSDTAYLRKSLKTNWENEKTNRTNLNLIKLFRKLGDKYSFDEVNYAPKTKQHPLFFTNAILGIKQSKLNEDGTEKGGLALPVKDRWYLETLDYLKRLIEIVEPKYIIAMGEKAYKAVCKIYNLTSEKTVSDAIANNGKRKILNGIDLFVVNHCSPNGCITRSIPIQVEDWTKIKNYM